MATRKRKSDAGDTVIAKVTSMKPGARNKIIGKVTSIRKGDIMSLIKIDVLTPAEMGSVITTESVEELNLGVGDEVELVIKAVHVLPIKLS